MPDDRNTLRGIDSEPDDLPVGPVREEWHPDRLLEKDKQIERFETLYGERIRSICGRILER